MVQHEIKRKNRNVLNLIIISFGALMNMTFAQADPIKVQKG